MPELYLPLSRLASYSASATRAAARESLRKQSSHRSFPVVPTCPPSSCTCSETPQNLDIDRSRSLNGTLAAYNKHVLVFSGQQNWRSRIEDEHTTSEWGKFTAEMKKSFGRKGEFHDPFMNIPVNTCSFEPGPNVQQAMLFPAFKQVTVSGAWQERLHDLAAYILSSSGSTAKDFTVSNIQQPVVLVCTHGGRDQRCGVLGPILVSEFRRQLRALDEQGKKLYSGRDTAFNPSAINVGGLSHIGGHKWAGNVMIYVPPKYILKHGDAAGSVSPLAGKGVCYGRVEPKHVDGIIKETILRGTVIEDLFRGGMDENGHTLRL